MRGLLLYGCNDWCTVKKRRVVAHLDIWIVIISAYAQPYIPHTACSHTDTNTCQAHTQAYIHASADTNTHRRTPPPLSPPALSLSCLHPAPASNCLPHLPPTIKQRLQKGKERLRTRSAHIAISAKIVLFKMLITYRALPCSYAHVCIYSEFLLPRVYTQCMRSRQRRQTNQRACLPV